MSFLWCIAVRLALVILAATAPAALLRALAVPALAIAVGFVTIWTFGLRKTGLETGGKPIWWDSLRPVHALNIMAFAYFAWRGQRALATTALLVDVLLGIFAHAWLKPRRM
jgi:hypothetical protein